MPRFHQLLLLFVLTAVAAPSAIARCTTLLPILSVDPDTAERSGVYTPGVCVAADRYPCELGPHYGSVTGGIRGSFWVLGFGDPRPGYGVDNGTFPAGYPGTRYSEIFYANGSPESWMKMETYGPASIWGAWSDDAGIDGCPGDLDGPTCTAVLLSDTYDDEGYFAFLTKRESDDGYVFSRPAGDAIRLARLPRPRLGKVKRVDSQTVRVAVAPPLVSKGFYLDRECDAGDPIGWRIRRQNVEGHTGAAPIGREISAWETVGGIHTLDSSKQTIDVRCETEQDIYLAYSIEFDSGYATEYVSANSRKIECGSGANIHAGTRWARIGFLVVLGLLAVACIWALRRSIRGRNEDERARIRHGSFAAMTLIAVLSVGLLIAELAFRRWGDPWPYREPGSLVGVKAYGESSEYLPMTIGPNLDIRRRTVEFDVNYKTNSEGFRDDTPLPPRKPPGEYRVLLCGDSFTWGQGVDFKDTYGEVAERVLNGSETGVYRAVNGGYRSGYTIDHYLAFLERESDRWSPDHIVVQIYTGNDLEDIRDNHWEAVDDKGFPLVIHSRRRWTDDRGRFIDERHYDPHLPSWLLRFRLPVGVARAFTGRYSIRQASTETVARERLELAIQAIHDHARRKGRRLTWLVVPSRVRGAQHLQTKAIVDPAIRALGDDLIDLEVEFRNSGIAWGSLFYERDGHLTEEGNRVLGELLARHIERTD